MTYSVNILYILANENKTKLLPLVDFWFRILSELHCLVAPFMAAKKKESAICFSAHHNRDVFSTTNVTQLTRVLLSSNCTEDGKRNDRLLKFE